MPSFRPRFDRRQIHEAGCIAVVWAVIVVCCLSNQSWSSASFAQDNAAPNKPKKETISFRNPERAYQTVKKGKWSIQVEKQLVIEAPEVADKATTRLSEKLDEVFDLLPKPAHGTLKQLRFIVLYGPDAKGGGLDNGLEYFNRTAPKFNERLDLRWTSCVVVYCAKNYVDLPELWATKALLHELAHAHHREHWPEDQPDIMAAWKNAVTEGLYKNVTDDEGKTHPKAYALTNQLEYFAELSAMYFAKSNYPPVDRDALREYDPAGFTMVEKMWGLSSGKQSPSKGAKKTTKAKN